MKTAVFLGAGASSAEGAPMQNSLFRGYFSTRNVQKLPEMYQVLGEFFRRVFDIDLSGPTDKIIFPTFEEALGVLDLSEIRRESLRGFNFGGASPMSGQPQPLGNHPPANANQVQLIRYYLTLAMAKAIDDGLKHKRKQAGGPAPAASPHKLLVSNLRKQNLLRHTIFISTNYDLLIDEALGMNLDYGVEFAGLHKFGGRETVGPNAVKLFKIHGSLNWLYCPVCNNLNGFEVKAVLSLLYPDRPITQCEFCSSIMSPVIVPPTFYKDMSRVFLSSIWNRAENALREADHVIFCGYSLPDADMHIKYLLKRMQTNRANLKSVRFTLVNHHKSPPKDNKVAAEEMGRYLRYLGRNVVDTKRSFSDFAANPKKFFAS
jgi:NAD-dependent SIR2 family protein deacetylase